MEENFIPKSRLPNTRVRMLQFCAVFTIALLLSLHSVMAASAGGGGSAKGVSAGTGAPSMSMDPTTDGIGASEMSLDHKVLNGDDMPDLRRELSLIIKAAKTLSDAEKYDDAYSKLLESDALADKTPKELEGIAEFRVLLGIRTKHFADSQVWIDHLPPTVAKDTRDRYLLAVATGLYNQNDFTNCIKAAKNYRDGGGPETDTALGLAFRSYFRLHDPAGGIQTGLQMIAQEEKSGARPNAATLTLLIEACGRSNDKAHLLDLLEKQVQYFPSPEHWSLLIGEQLDQAGPAADPYSLDILRLMKSVNMMNDADGYTDYVALARNAGQMTEASKVIEEGYGRQILGSGKDGPKQDALRKSLQTESALEVANLGKAEAEAATGDSLLNLGMTEAVLGHFDKANALMERGVARGVKSPDQARLWLGIVSLAARQGRAGFFRKSRHPDCVNWRVSGLSRPNSDKQAGPFAPTYSLEGERGAYPRPGFHQ